MQCRTELRDHLPRLLPPEATKPLAATNDPTPMSISPACACDVMFHIHFQPLLQAVIMLAARVDVPTCAVCFHFGKAARKGVEVDCQDGDAGRQHHGPPVLAHKSA